MNFIDLFCGAGGLSCGLEQNPDLNCLLGVDFNLDAIDTFGINHPYSNTFCGDIRELSLEKIKELTNNQKIDLIVGGPPCQGFSTAGRGDPNDPRNQLFLEFVRIVRDIKPKFIVVENVAGLLAKKNEQTFLAIAKEFSNLGYALHFELVSMEKYGVPEKRKRTIFIGSLVHKIVPFPEPTNEISTIRDAWFPLQESGRLMNENDLLHTEATIKNFTEVSRIQHIPEGKCVRYQKDEDKYLPEHLKFGIDWSKLKENRFRQNKLHRLDRNSQAPTIMTSSTMYYHPTEDRYLTSMEAALIQTFPAHYIFVGSKVSRWRQIGNAVPPKFGKILGQHLLTLEKEFGNIEE